MDNKEDRVKSLDILNPWEDLKGRDPERVHEVLGLLFSFWKKNSDLRLGQIVENIASRSGHHAFYMEDEIVKEWLKKDLKED